MYTFMVTHDHGKLPEKVAMKNRFLTQDKLGYDPIRKIHTVISGLRYAITDVSVAYKVVLSVVVMVATLFLHQWANFLIILLATGLVLITEIVNSAIESLCDFVEERHNEKIKIIKDIAAAAVGISIIVWGVIVVVELQKMLSPYF